MAHLLAVPKEQWKSFFEGMSHAVLGKRAEIEVASLDLGDQIVAEWIPLLGITYDSKDDVLDVALDGSDHLIRHPRDILVDEGPVGLSSVAVVDAEGTREIIRLKEPLKLPPAATPE
jgi:hypothetical protein